MPTNGSRNAAASSHALKVGAQTPMSGENASPTPCPTAVPLSPLASAYVRTALMNDTPTSGPMATSRIHHERDATSSRHSFLSSHAKACLCEGEKDIFQVSRLGLTGFQVSRLGLTGFQVSTLGLTGLATQLIERSFAADAPAAQQHEPIAHACRVVDLMDRQEHRPAAARMRAQRVR